MLIDIDENIIENLPKLEEKELSKKHKQLNCGFLYLFGLTATFTFSYRLRVFVSS